jgi:hypothetical protein
MLTLLTLMLWGIFQLQGITQWNEMHWQCLPYRQYCQHDELSWQSSSTCIEALLPIFSHIVVCSASQLTFWQYILFWNGLHWLSRQWAHNCPSLCANILFSSQAKKGIAFSAQEIVLQGHELTGFLKRPRDSIALLRMWLTMVFLANRQHSDSNLFIWNLYLDDFFPKALS